MIEDEVLNEISDQLAKAGAKHIVDCWDKGINPFTGLKIEPPTKAELARREREQLLNTLKWQKEALLAADKAHRDTLSRLSVGCLHEQQGPHRWEHDNGYGRQSINEGMRCSLCGFIDFYKRNTWVNPKDL